MERSSVQTQTNRFSLENDRRSRRRRRRTVVSLENIVKIVIYFFCKKLWNSYVCIRNKLIHYIHIKILISAQAHALKNLFHRVMVRELRRFHLTTTLCLTNYCKRTLVITKRVSLLPTLLPLFSDTFSGFDGMGSGGGEIVE